MAQTSITAQPAKGVPGQIADSAQAKDDWSAIVEEAGGIAPGLLVVRGTDPERQASLPAGAFTADDILGVSVFTHKARRDGAVSNNEVYEDEDRMPVRRKGRIWVTVEDAFVAGDPAFARHTGGGEGLFRTDIDGGNAAAVAGARFVSSGGAGDLAILELNL